MKSIDIPLLTGTNKLSLKFLLMTSIFAFGLLTGCATKSSAPAPAASTSSNPSANPSANTNAERSNLGESYILDSGDRISIQVFDEQDLTMEALVDSNGVINYSFLGTLEVSGRTTEQIEQKITELLENGYLVKPSVNVTVTGYRLFYISGEVNKPGGYPYVPGLNLEQALAMAGGLTDRASKRKMYLVKGGSSDNNRKRVNLNTSIDPGDTITIEEGFF